MFRHKLLWGSLLVLVTTMATAAGVAFLVADWMVERPVVNKFATAPLAADFTLEAAAVSNGLADMIERVIPAVVSVVVTKDVPVYERYFEEIDPWGFWGGFSVPRVRELGTEERQVGGGSGFFVSADGLIVTNRHVVSDADARYSVLTNDGRVYEVDVLARDPHLDIAILQVRHLAPGETVPYLVSVIQENCG